MTKDTANYWIQKLNLKRHPEGGWYCETYRSKESILKASLPSRYSNNHNFGTAIYFLLQSREISAFHRILSDELWFYHLGSALEIVSMGDKGVTKTILGPNLDEGQTFQAIISKETWFGARVLEEESFTLASCTVSPGFEFEDFELAKRVELEKEFPEHKELISLFTSI